WSSDVCSSDLGMTPAMFTRSGMYVEPPAVIRRPTMRFAYWIGIRRCPSWTKTTATTMPIAISGKNSRSIGPPFHQAEMPSGALVRIDAKVRIEMPLPTPRFVISSRSHMRTAREEAEQAEHRAAVALEEPLDRVRVHARRGDPRPQAVDREDERREEHPVPELGHSPRVAEPREHRRLAPAFRGLELGLCLL